MRENIGLIALALILTVVLAGATAHKDALRAKIDEALAQGQDFSFETDAADHLGIDKSLAAKVLRVPAERSTDGMMHAFNLILHEGRPFRVIFWTTRRAKTEETSEAFAIETDGRIRRAILEESAVDAAGRLVPGTIADLKIHSPAVRHAYQHELNFWLDGKYRKTPP